MLEKFDFNWTNPYDYIAVLVGLFAFIKRKAIGRFIKSSVDEDKDGRVNWSTELRPILYFCLIAYMVYKEGEVLGEVYSDTWIIFTSLGALGVEAVTAVLKYMTLKVKSRPQPNDGEVPIQ